MRTELRRTGIDVLRDMPWGTHCCHFYETKGDLIDALVGCCAAGLARHEFCLWVIAAPVTKDAAADALRRVVPDIDRYVV